MMNAEHLNNGTFVEMVGQDAAQGVLVKAQRSQAVVPMKEAQPHSRGIIYTISSGGWFEPNSYKEDDSNCNWKPEYWTIKNYDEEYPKNSTMQFYAWQGGDADNSAKRRDVIAVWKDIPDSVKNCTIHWYKPMAGIFYGTYGDGTFNISLIDTGDKDIKEAVGREINWKNTNKLCESEKRTGVLDLGNWGWTVKHAYLNNAYTIDCSGKKELVVHFAMSAGGENAVIIDQVSEKDQVNSFVQRAGWVLRYD